MLKKLGNNKDTVNVILYCVKIKDLIVHISTVLLVSAHYAKSSVKHPGNSIACLVNLSKIKYKKNKSKLKITY